jgi:hypothetical protein
VRQQFLGDFHLQPISICPGVFGKRENAEYDLDIKRFWITLRRMP